MKKIEKRAMLIFLLSSVISLIFSIIILWTKLLETSSVLFAITGLVQLELTGFFDNLIRKFSDEEKYPYGPPSRISREILDNPETPYLTYLKNLFFYNRKFGLGLLFLSSFIQLLLIWIK